MKILTLNCWGLPIIGPRKRRRIKAITWALRHSDYDVVALQEVWLRRDAEYMIQKAGYRYHARFLSPSFFDGSGLLLLSKFPILEKDFYEYCIIGFPHRFFEGDFYSRRGVGYALLKTPKGNVHFFNTHLIARYGPRNKKDINKVFRMGQIFELIHFIRQKASPHGFVLAGDLNAMDHDLELDTLCAFTGVPRGERIGLHSIKRQIDHIICGSTVNGKRDQNLRSCRLVLNETVHRPIPTYSDHPGVLADIRFGHKPSDFSGRKQTLKRALHYFRFKMDFILIIDRRVRKIPIYGLIHSWFVRPQLRLIEILVRWLESEVRQLK